MTDRARSPTHQRRHRPNGRALGAKVIAALIAVVVVVAIGIGWITYRRASAGITKSEALAGEPASTGSDQNILIMGLDSRRDQHGRPLPPDIYDALHAGNEDSADGDADALIVVHLPAGDGPATAISIPRDDYVDLAGCPASECRGKVKEAYSLAYERVMEGRGSYKPESDAASPARQDSAAKEQAAREAGRKAEIGTVRRLLQIPIDHFIEVTLAGFFQIARVVEPLTVCLKEDTADRYYSGADFHRGIQQINATQAMAFVRQRRDANDAMFTDLDRTRRQQAFIASLVSALRRGGALSDPIRLHGLLEVAKQNVAVDAGFDLDELARDASAFQSRSVSLYTLPVTGFGEISNGAFVNFIDVSAVRSIVQNLVAADPSAATSTSIPSTTAQPGDDTSLAAGGVALDVVNASGRQGEAADLEMALATGHFSKGKVSTADSTSQTSTIAYGPGAKIAAAELADEFGITATASDGVDRNTVRLTVGTDFARFDNFHPTSASPATTSAAPVSTVPATGTGTQEPAATNLTRMTADGIPCVK
ncbi:transcriptional regulator [Mycobacterium sp. IS-2888]|uniref:LCP family protein n=1 Tax=Mycobacterium sp. IS-2888 TaxID=1834159 RepID=UPI00096C1BD6|nr:LCP family protein [Mycobacterium sp. IS-2888]OMC50399.1 transcriptional regulator [Mycobacterium sp. IS-2888]